MRSCIMGKLRLSWKALLAQSTSNAKCVSSSQLYADQTVTYAAQYFDSVALAAGV